MKSTAIYYLILMGLSISFVARACDDPAGSAHGAAKPEAVAVPMSEGEIRKIDKNAGKITIKHGELKDLGMPPMTMVFRVKHPTMLENIKTGDKIRFVVEKIEGMFTVTKLEAVR